MSGKYILKAAAGGKFRFNLCAGNGQVILTSEAYSSKKSALNGIAAVAKNAVNEGSIDRKVAKNGKPYFNLKARNGQVIGKSQMYASNAAMEKGIRSVASNGRSLIDDRAGGQSVDMTGVPADIADDSELVRSWHAAAAHLSDPDVSERVRKTLDSLGRSAGETMSKDEFLAATSSVVA